MLITVDHFRHNVTDPASVSHVNPAHVVRIAKRDNNPAHRVFMLSGQYIEITEESAQRLINIANGEPILAPPIDLLCDVLTLCREAIGTLSSTEWRYNTLEKLTRYIREEQERR